MSNIGITSFKPKGQRLSKAEKAALAVQGLKWCATCRTAKRQEAFGPDKSRADGLQNRCRDCDNARCRRYHSEHLERCRARSRRYYLANREAVLVRARAYAREYYAEFQRNKARIVRIIAYFSERPSYLDRIVEEIVWSAEAERLQYASREIEEACARHVGDI